MNNKAEIIARVPYKKGENGCSMSYDWIMFLRYEHFCFYCKNSNNNKIDLLSRE